MDTALLVMYFELEAKKKVRATRKGAWGFLEISPLEIFPTRESRTEISRSVQEFFLLSMADLDPAAHVLFLVEGAFAGIVFLLLLGHGGLFVFAV